MANKAEGYIFYILLSAVLLFPCKSLYCAGSDAGSSDLDTTRASLEKWVETRRIISEEKHGWELGKEMLDERIALVQREIDQLKEKISGAEKDITETDKKRAGMAEENEALKAASSGMSAAAAGLEDRTRKLLARLPEQLRERVKPLSQRFPDDARNTKLSLSERFQNIVGVLNEVDKFNREISASSEVRKLSDGTSAEVTALYVGISQGYYASPNRAAAGTGTASADAWVWTADNKAADRIADAIAILKNEKVASFVQLPVRIE